jgi:FMN-dependent NADH-azoreductase
MTTILQILVSPRPHSFSNRIARDVTARLVALYPRAEIIARDLAAAPPPHPEFDLYEAILTPTVGDDDPRYALSERLIGELEAADFVVIGTPMNNFSVPSTLKAWVDHIVRIRRTFRSTPEGKIGTLRDRPVFVVTAHGGPMSGGYQPDFLTPYLRVIFETIGIRQVEFFCADGLSRGPEAVARALDQAKGWLDEKLPETIR